MAMESKRVDDDNILFNILGRLPLKTLLRFKCVSPHWHSIITDPYCMKSRARRMIILPNSQYHLSLIKQEEKEEKEEEENNCQYSTLEVIRSPFLYPNASEYLTTLGSCNGIVLLVLAHDSEISKMILYNPLTRASKGVELPPYQYRLHKSTFIYGFGYGATPDELKIVRIEFSVKDGNICDVFDVKTNSWSTPQVIIPKYDYVPNNGVGKFLNGYLYWFAREIKYEILALNVKEMVFSKIDLPFHHQDRQHPICGLLGAINGCLCMITKKEINFNGDFTSLFESKCYNGYGLWVMKAEQGTDNVSWVKECSFTFTLEGSTNPSFFKMIRPISILDKGKIMIMEPVPLSPCQELYIYDTIKKSCQKLNSSVTALNINILPFVPVIEYVESLVSP